MSFIGLTDRWNTILWRYFKNGCPSDMHSSSATSLSDAALTPLRCRSRQSPYFLRENPKKLKTRLRLCKCDRFLTTYPFLVFAGNSWWKFFPMKLIRISSLGCLTVPDSKSTKRKPLLVVSAAPRLQGADNPKPETKLPTCSVVPKKYCLVISRRQNSPHSWVRFLAFWTSNDFVHFLTQLTTCFTDSKA